MFMEKAAVELNLANRKQWINYDANGKKYEGLRSSLLNLKPKKERLLSQ